MAGEHCDHETRLWAQEHFGVSGKFCTEYIPLIDEMAKFSPQVVSQKYDKVADDRSNLM